MKNRRIRKGWRWGGAGALAFWLTASGAWGGLAVPLYVGNLVPVLDQHGQPLAGTYDADPATCARVEIRTAASGVIQPPAVTGAPHPLTPLLSTNSVGVIGMNTTSPGLFAMVFPLRPATGTKLFARAYNAPTVEAASFYVDSTVGTVTDTGISLVLTFGPAKPLDEGDVDGDGLINSWEKALGTDDRATADYDGDGMSDLAEMMSGTDPKDPGSVLAFRSIASAPDVAPATADGAATRSLRMKFLSVPGRTYQLEAATDLLSDPAFEPVGETMLAGEDEFEIEVLMDIPSESAAGTFRVRMLEE